MRVRLCIFLKDYDYVEKRIKKSGKANKKHIGYKTDRNNEAKKVGTNNKSEVKKM